jgi:hypothetical protein
MSYLREGIATGLTAEQAYNNVLEEVRANTEATGERWYGVRKYTFQQTYAATRQARGNVPQALVAPRDEPGGGLSIPERPATVPGGYLNAGISATRAIGASDVEVNVHLFRTNELLTPAEVEDYIRAQIEESNWEKYFGGSPFTIESVAFTGVQKLIKE